MLDKVNPSSYHFSPAPAQGGVQSGESHRLEHVSQLSTKELGRLKKTFRTDEKYYTIGAMHIFLSIYLTARLPAYYWVLHFATEAVVYPWRYIRFRHWKGQLYLLDWCYCVTYYTTVCILFAASRHYFGIVTPLVVYNTELLHAGFCFSTGALAWSVLIFRNSMVFHDIDQMTSVYTHLSPAVLFWTLRWGGGYGFSEVERSFPTMFHMCPDTTPAHADSCMFQAWCTACPMRAADATLTPIVLYAVLWAVPYGVLIFLGLPGYIERHGMDTLYRFSTKDKQGNLLRTGVGGLLARVSERWRPLAYLGMHATLVAVTNACSFVFWHSFWAHTAFILALVVISVRNGASYVFEVFAIRYADDMLHDYEEMVTTVTAA